MVANIRGYTPNYSFKLVNFDTPRWHTLEYANWNQLDAILLQAGIAQVRGEWLYNTTYLIGDRVFDGVTNDLYRCLIQHTSASSGTFEQDRLARPMMWELQLPGVPLFRGAWQANATYAIGDIVFTDEFTYRLCSDAHTSSVTFPPDVAYWQIIFDASASVATAEQAAVDASISAAGAASSANASNSSALNSAASAGASQVSATASQTSANEADISEANAFSSANAAAASAVGAANSALDAADSAVVAANQSAALRGTSTTTNDISLGPKLFETQTDKLFEPGTFLTFVNNNDPSVAMTGMSLSYSGGSLSANISGITGAGVSSSWNIYVSGMEGLDGVNGTPGQPGIDGDPGLMWRGNWNSTTQYALRDAVADNGNSYIAAIANINSRPPNVNWGLLAQGGTTAIADDQVVPSYLDADTQAKQLLFRDRLNLVSREGDTVTGLIHLPTIPPPVNTSAVRKDYVDTAVAAVDLTSRVAKAGDTMTGHLVLPTGPGATNAVRKDYVDAADVLKVAKAGDTMTGHLSLPVSPSNDHAVRRDYVDAGDAAVVSNAVMKNVPARQGMIGSLQILRNAADGAVLSLVNQIASGSHWDIASSGADHGPVGDLCFWHNGQSTIMRLRPSDRAIIGAGPVAAAGGFYAGYQQNSGFIQFADDGQISFVKGEPIKINKQTRIDASDLHLNLVAPAGGYARTFHTISGVRVWASGAWNNGGWYLSDETAAAVRLSIDTAGTVTVNNSLNVGAWFNTNGMTSSGDITTYRAASPGTGVVFFGNSGTRYIYYTGGEFSFSGGPISAGEPSGAGHLTTKGYVDGKVGGAAFLPLSGGVVQGKLTANGGVWTTMSYGGSAGALEVTGPGGGAEAIISFHRQGAFGINFGLGTSNHLTYGGWSHGGSVWSVWSNAYFGYPTQTCRLSYAGDWSAPAGPGNIDEPYGGAVVTGANAYNAYSVYQLRFRYLQVLTDNWYTVGYA